MIALLRHVVMVAPALISCTTTSVYANYLTLDAIVMQNWILALPTSAATEPNAHRLATIWILHALANWATRAVCVMKTLTNAHLNLVKTTAPAPT
jgi:hypothetical protein